MYLKLVAINPWRRGRKRKLRDGTMGGLTRKPIKLTKPRDSKFKKDTYKKKLIDPFELERMLTPTSRKSKRAPRGVAEES